MASRAARPPRQRSLNQGAVLLAQDAGDFDTNQAFSYRRLGQAAGERRLSGAILARMDDDSGLSRLGPVGRRPAASARTSSTSGRTTR